MTENALFARGCHLFHLSSQSLPTVFFFLALVSSPGSFSLPVRFIMHKHTLCCALNNPISTIKLGGKRQKRLRAKAFISAGNLLRATIIVSTSASTFSLQCFREAGNVPPTVRVCSPASFPSGPDQTTVPLIATVARLKKNGHKTWRRNCALG